MYSKLANPQNYQEIKRKERDIKYIVIHYTGNDGDTARNNLDYFHENVVKASAHFFVDEKEICCSVPWYNIAWHCGTKNGYKHEECRNKNSIGIEICSRKNKNGEYYFDTQAVRVAAEFTAQQIKNYGIPLGNVLRHYDVTGKLCPRPFIDETTWNDFKNLVWMFYQVKAGEKITYYEKLEDIPKGEKRDVVKKLINRGTIKGTTDGNLHLSDDMVRMMVFNNREGLYK